MRPLGSWGFRVKGRSRAEKSTRERRQGGLQTKPNLAHPMMFLGVDLMWETAENFQNRLIINEFCRAQYANSSELLWESKSPKYNRIRLERNGEWGKGEQKKRGGKRETVRREKRRRRKKREERHHGNQSTSRDTLYLVGTWLHKNQTCAPLVVGQAAGTSFPQCAARLECFRPLACPHLLALLITAHSFENFSF